MRFASNPGRGGWPVQPIRDGTALWSCPALRRPARAARDVGQHEELPPRVSPACRLQDRAWLASGLVELAVAAIGVGLEQPGISRQVALQMLATAVARVVEYRTGRCRSAERPGVAHVGPEPGDVGLAPRQHGHGGILIGTPSRP